MTWQRAVSALLGSGTGPKREWTAEVAAAVEGEFPGWHVWISSAGRWWATRTGRHARHGYDDPRPMTVDADDSNGLCAQLAAWSEQRP